MLQAFAVSSTISIARSKSLHNLLAEDCSDLAQLLNQFAELSRRELLRTVGEGFGRIRMHFDHDRVGACRHCSLGKLWHEFAHAFGMRNIDADREERLLMDDRHRRDIEREACGGLERA